MLYEVITEQIPRMNEIIQYQLKSAAVAGRVAFATYYKARYEIHVFWITVMMIFAITLLLPAEPYIAFYRALDTLTGVILAVLAMYLFRNNFV